jgi:hypothetical protein
MPMQNEVLYFRRRKTIARRKIWAMAHYEEVFSSEGICFGSMSNLHFMTASS